MNRSYGNEGWYRKEGLLNDNSKQNLFPFLSQSLFSGKHTTTYKYCFLKSILDNLYSFNEAFEISFEVIGETFASIYWNMIVVHKIPQMTDYLTGEMSVFERITSDIIKDKPYLDGIHYESINKDDKLVFLKKAIPEFSKNFIGAFYNDTSGMIYGFSKKERKIWLNSFSFNFLSENKTIIEQVNFYQWLKMVDRILKSNHKNIDNLSTILEEIIRRSDLTFFKNQLEKIGEQRVCFYCNKKLGKSAHLDHVIPWDFIKSDDLWNFVFSCPSCNSSKSNSIPDIEYLDKLIQRNKTKAIKSSNIHDVANAARLNGIRCGWKPKEHL